MSAGKHPYNVPPHNVLGVADRVAGRAMDFARDMSDERCALRDENRKLKDGSARLREQIATRAPSAVRGGSLCKSVLALLDEYEQLREQLRVACADASGDPS